MTALEICLIIAGIIVTVASFFVTEKVAEPLQEDYILGELEKNLLSEKNLEKLFERIQEKLTEEMDEMVDEAVIKTDDHLSQISNEKIISVTELTDQVLDKVNQNHTEVVFLYNMLTEKEKELKDYVAKIESVKSQVEKLQIEAVKNGTISPPQIKRREENEEIKSKTIPQNTSVAKQVEALQEITKRKQPPKLKKKEETNRSEVGTELPEYKIVKARETSSLNGTSTNNNEEILRLYAEGNSIIEISKKLGLGQGEVKLVVELFKNMR